MKEPKVFTRHLICKLTESEWTARAGECAKSVGDLAEEEKRQADQKAQMKATLTDIERRVSELSTAVIRREEYRDVECIEEIALDENRVLTVRTDTGEVLGRRPLTDEERQEPIKF